MTRFTTIMALVITSVALAAPMAHASSTAPLTATETARLGGQTEAAGFKGIDRYLKLHFAQKHAAQTAQARDVAKAAWYKAENRYLKQRYAEQLAAQKHARAHTAATRFCDCDGGRPGGTARVASGPVASVSSSECPCNIGLPTGPSADGDVGGAPTAVTAPIIPNRSTTSG
jgi:hypothetical protein